MQSTILYVEDDAATSQVVQALLESTGHTVHTAPNGLVAAQILEEGLRPSLILLDLMLPEMNGLALLRELKQDPELAALTVVVVSAYAKLADIALHNGAAGYLAKPIRPEELLAAIADASGPR